MDAFTSVAYAATPKAYMGDRVAPELPSATPTGIDGLDAILHGGLPREEMHNLQGTAGTGKTTAALQFLREALIDRPADADRLIDAIARFVGGQ